MTSYQAHVQKWTGCMRCPLHEGRNRMVFARGRLPCDVLFVGEAPGQSEDILGQPFVGPAGHLLDKIISKGLPSHLTCAMTNLVCCFPKEEKKAGINEPPDEAIRACQPRLVEQIALASPRLIVCVGRLSEVWLDQDRRYSIKVNVPRVEIAHPASILRANIAQQGLAIQRCIVRLATASENL